MVKNYEKPQMHFVNVQSEESVANICWGGFIKKNGRATTWAYYGADLKLEEPDDPNGWFSFQIDGGNCQKAALTNVTYMGAANDGTEDDVDLQNKLMSEFWSQVDVSNAGSNWTGEGTITPIISSK